MLSRRTGWGVSRNRLRATPPLPMSRARFESAYGPNNGVEPALQNCIAQPRETQREKKWAGKCSNQPKAVVVSLSQGRTSPYLRVSRVIIRLSLAVYHSYHIGSVSDQSDPLICDVKWPCCLGGVRLTRSLTGHYQGRVKDGKRGFESHCRLSILRLFLGFPPPWVKYGHNTGTLPSEVGAGCVRPPPVR